MYAPPTDEEDENGEMHTANTTANREGLYAHHDASLLDDQPLPLLPAQPFIIYHTESGAPCFAGVSMTDRPTTSSSAATSKSVPSSSLTTQTTLTPYAARHGLSALDVGVSSSSSSLRGVVPKHTSSSHTTSSATPHPTTDSPFPLTLTLSSFPHTDSSEASTMLSHPPSHLVASSTANPQPQLPVQMAFSLPMQIASMPMQVPSMQVPSMQVPSMQVPSMQIPSMQVPSMQMQIPHMQMQIPHMQMQIPHMPLQYQYHLVSSPWVNMLSPYALQADPAVIHLLPTESGLMQAQAFHHPQQNTHSLMQHTPVMIPNTAEHLQDPHVDIPSPTSQPKMKKEHALQGSDHISLGQRHASSILSTPNPNPSHSISQSSFSMLQQHSHQPQHQHHQNQHPSAEDVAAAQNYAQAIQMLQMQHSKTRKAPLAATLTQQPQQRHQFHQPYPSQQVQQTHLPEKPVDQASDGGSVIGKSKQKGPLADHSPKSHSSITIDDHSSSRSRKRKPINAFFVYSKFRRAEVRKTDPFIGNYEILRIIATEWRTLSPSRKAPFEAMATDMNKARDEGRDEGDDTSILTGSSQPLNRQ
eukprot:TRINITY_DN11167_c0_g1_i1.p1 TRINITY_DN11167_c0_g1~~TRINITY_DN11167_c0_g1_i1.p1  ORF type:complete len:584 (+),score=132.09 TRINITY_DN11167_c0_g1_i1:125-1876(+)